MAQLSFCRRVEKKVWPGIRMRFTMASACRITTDSPRPTSASSCPSTVKTKVPARSSGQTVTVSLDENLYAALEKISLKDFAVLPVVSAQDPSRLEGVISRRDIIGAYNKAVLKKSLFK